MTEYITKYALTFDHRSDGGPHLVGPFDSHDEAQAHIAELTEPGWEASYSVTPILKMKERRAMGRRWAVDVIARSLAAHKRWVPGLNISPGQERTIARNIVTELAPLFDSVESVRLLGEELKSKHGHMSSTWCSVVGQQILSRLNGESLDNEPLPAPIQQWTPSHVELRSGQCNNNGGQGIGAGHVCYCNGKPGHDGKHGCSCGAMW